MINAETFVHGRASVQARLGRSTTMSRPTLFGMNVRHVSGAYSDAFAAAQATYGPFNIVRVFHSGLPAAWNTFYGTITQPQCTSFKMAPQDVLAGTHDTYMANWFATAPTDRPTFWSFHPEPEDDIQGGSYTAAQFRDACRRLFGLAAAAGNPMLVHTLILMWWTSSPSSGRNMDDYYPGDDVTDVIAWDSYNWAGDQASPRYATPEELFPVMFALTGAKGKPIAFAEFGSVLVAGDNGSNRAAWLLDAAAYLEERNMLFVTYWNDAVGAFDAQLLDTPSINAWASVMAT